MGIPHTHPYSPTHNSQLTLTLLFAVLLSLLFPFTVHAVDVLNAEEKAKKLHELASSDVIYTDQETKALYYQNIQIIDLLTQIRDLLEMRLAEPKE
ncbi:MAG: hypothetical protein HYT89_06855 [Candidatus Omnitrophica bacterium]|nr:hypothetical protein [Candidatus Omnitrophota bacterium]